MFDNAPKKPVRGDYDRRWLSDDFFDLVIWYRPDGTISGSVYAQPLYVENGPGGVAMIIVATETNRVYALNASTSSVIWQRSVGAGSNVRGHPVLGFALDPAKISHVASAVGFAIGVDDLTIDDGPGFQWEISCKYTARAAWMTSAMGC